MGSSLKWSPHNAPLGVLSDTKVLAKEKRKPSPNPKYWNRDVLKITYLSSIWRNYFPQIAELNWQIFQDKKEDFFDTQKYTHTHAHTRIHTHKLDFSADYGAHSPLFMFEFDSYQVVLCLLCYILPVQEFYFWFKF